MELSPVTRAVLEDLQPFISQRAGPELVDYGKAHAQVAQMLIERDNQRLTNNRNWRAVALDHAILSILCLKSDLLRKWSPEIESLYWLQIETARRLVDL